jgi:hypothetical protein
MVSATDTPINDSDKTVQVITNYELDTVTLSVAVPTARIIIALSEDDRRRLAGALTFGLKD